MWEGRRVNDAAHVDLIRAGYTFDVPSATLGVLIADDQPVIGFDRGVEGPIDERVREYLPKLREVQPHGPYVLVGWSFGGALAYAREPTEFVNEFFECYRK